MKKLFSLKFWMLGVGILFFIISNQVVYAIFSGSVSTNPSTIDLVGMKRTFKVTENKDISFKSVGDSQTQTWKLYNTYERAQLHYPDEADQGETLETIKENYTVYFADDPDKNRLTDSQAYLDVKIDSQERKHEFVYNEKSDINVTFTKRKEFPDSWKGHDIMIRTKFYGYDFTGRLFTEFVYVKVNNAIPDRQGEYSIVQPLYYSDVNGQMTTVQPGILWLHVHNLENYKEKNKEKNKDWKQEIENTAFKSAGLNTTNLSAKIIDEQEDWVKVKIDIPKNTKAPTRKTVINFMINGYGDFNGYIQPNDNIHEFIKPLCIESDFTNSEHRNADTIRKDDLTISLNRQQKQILHLYSGNSVENSYFTSFAATQLDHSKYTVKVMDENNNQVATDLHASLVNVDGGSAIEFTRDNSTSNKAYELQIYDKSDNIVFFRPIKTINHATYKVIQPMYYSIYNNKLTSVLPMKLNVQIFDAKSINEDELKQVILDSGFTVMNPVYNNLVNDSNSWNIKITERDTDFCLVNLYYNVDAIDARGSDLLPYSENYRPFYLSTDWNPFTGKLISGISSIYTRRTDLFMKPVTIDSNKNVTAIPDEHLTDLKNLNVAINDACNFTVGKNEKGFTIKQNIDYKDRTATFNIKSSQGIVFARKVTSVKINYSDFSTLHFDEITQLQNSTVSTIITDLNQRIKISGAVDLTSNQVNSWEKRWYQGICGLYWMYKPVSRSVEGVNNFVIRIDQLVNDNYNQYPTGLLLVQYNYDYDSRWYYDNNASAEYSRDGKYLIMHFNNSVKNNFTLSYN
ncbi:hypothetical protein CIRMBP1197_02312 [Enterococcus cecorum]|nr:hypothetical protein CIRMBP1197_02312 [Enterococcus cecorum]